ncbi:MAG: hypothetical protein ACI4MH_07555 [Candidatus Coproplasma sp.]
MARKSKQQKGTITLAAASEELATRLVKVYKCQTFVRTGKDLAEMLFKTGVEAGAVLSGIAELPSRQAKIDAANQAIIKLNQVQYIADVMCKAELYKPAQVEPLTQYIAKVIAALKELLASVPEVRRVIRLDTPVGVVDTNPKKPAIVINSSAPVGVVTSPVANLPAGNYGDKNYQTPDVQVYQSSDEDGFNEMI